MGSNLAYKKGFDQDDFFFFFVGKVIPIGHAFDANLLKQSASISSHVNIITHPHLVTTF